MEAIIGITYRCNARCHMCNTWKNPSKEVDEISPSLMEKLPSSLKFVNITGGEPFLREDLDEFVSILTRKSKRVVISTNGFYTDRIMMLARKYHDIGFRISLEGLPERNDELRGIANCFDHGLRTLLQLKDLGIKDIGFGITASDKNARDIIDLFRLARSLKVEFATAIVHNSYYFHKNDNEIKRQKELIDEFNRLIAEFFRSRRIKNWFRAYFNYGIINYIEGKKRLLPCNVGQDLFYLDPFGEVHPCNGMDDSMGNLKEKDWDSIWLGQKAQQIREKVKNCDKNCWMIGSAAPAMKKDILKPMLWILKNRAYYLKNFR